MPPGAGIQAFIRGREAKFRLQKQEQDLKIREEESKRAEDAFKSNQQILKFNLENAEAELKAQKVQAQRLVFEDRQSALNRVLTGVSRLPSESQQIRGVTPTPTGREEEQQMSLPLGVREPDVTIESPSGQFTFGPEEVELNRRRNIQQEVASIQRLVQESAAKAIGPAAISGQIGVERRTATDLANDRRITAARLSRDEAKGRAKIVASARIKAAEILSAEDPEVREGLILNASAIGYGSRNVSSGVLGLKERSVLSKTKPGWVAISVNSKKAITNLSGVITALSQMELFLNSNRLSESLPKEALKKGIENFKDLFGLSEIKLQLNSIEAIATNFVKLEGDTGNIAWREAERQIKRLPGLGLPRREVVRRIIDIKNELAFKLKLELPNVSEEQFNEVFPDVLSRIEVKEDLTSGFTDVDIEKLMRTTNSTREEVIEALR